MTASNAKLRESIGSRGFATVETAMPVSEVERFWRPLFLPQLQDLLHRGESLPKDGFIDTDIAGLHSNPFRNRDRNYERAVLHALTDPKATTKQMELALRIANCHRRNRCGRIACFICRQRYWKERRTLAERIAATPPNDDVSWCTVIIGQSQVGYPVVRAMISRFKIDFTEALRRFSSLRWSGRIEIDYVDHRLHSSSPQKAETLQDMGWEWDCELPTLVPHNHSIVVHPNVHRSTLAYHLKRLFPYSRQIQVRPLRITRDRADSLDSLVRYPLKPSLAKEYLAGRNSTNHVPRNPAVVRYITQVHESLDRPSRRWQMEFDRL